MTPPCTASPQLFFAPEGETATHRDWREGRAKAICARCPFQVPCLEFALTERIKYGIWGGATEAGRVKLARWRRDQALRDRGWRKKAAA